MALNPPAIPSDTSPEAWSVQMDAIGRRSIHDRMMEWEELNRRGAEMEADGVRRRHPEFSERDVFLTLVRLRYGDELACKVWPETHALIEAEVGL